ncbi:MAG: HAMP domain-containing histidine kinase [Acidobacteria bacterium]|nr:HAMP domain-containing histidine kinase [Acidobacteriota bacterium]
MTSLSIKNNSKTSRSSKASKASKVNNLLISLELATQEKLAPNFKVEKKIVNLLSQCIKSISNYSDYSEVIGIFLQPKNNFVTSTNKLSYQTKTLLKDLQLSKTKLKKLCQSATPLKLAHYGTSYYFSTQEKMPIELEAIFKSLSTTSSDYIINPLVKLNGTILGLVIVTYPNPGIIPKLNSILPIITFSSEFISGYEKILLSSETLLLKKQPPPQDLLQVDNYLKTLEKTRQEFVAMLVHDIRSPLTVVLGTLDLLLIQSRKKTDIKLTPNLNALINNAYETCKQIIHMVTELLDLSRMEYSPLQLHKTSISPQELITSVVEECYASATEKQIRLNFGSSPDLKPFLADQQYLQRALVNLLSNAIKYTPERGEIWFEARAIKGNGDQKILSFTVIDSGLGISEEEQSQVFDPYFQASNRKGQLGIGLGLAIVKKIALAHGGNVSVKSQLGVGSAFSLSIPIDL